MATQDHRHAQRTARIRQTASVVLTLAALALYYFWRSADMRRDDWLPLIAVLVIFIPLYLLARRFMRGTLSTAMVGVLLGLVLIGLLSIFFPTSQDLFLLLLFGAGYGAFVAVFHERVRFDDATSTRSTDNVRSNSSSSGREEA